MKRRMRPFVNMVNKPVLHRIPVNIIDMTLKVGLIADLMLPITALLKS